MSLEDDLFEQRLRRADEIEARGFRAYGQRFDFTHTIPQILASHGAGTAEELEKDKPRVSHCGPHPNHPPDGQRPASCT